jgi:hypothetical protein
MRPEKKLLVKLLCRCRVIVVQLLKVLLAGPWADEHMKINHLDPPLTHLRYKKRDDFNFETCMPNGRVHLEYRTWRPLRRHFLFQYMSLSHCRSSWICILCKTLRPFGHNRIRLHRMTCRSEHEGWGGRSWKWVWGWKSHGDVMRVNIGQFGMNIMKAGVADSWDVNLRRNCFGMGKVCE